MRRTVTSRLIIALIVLAMPLFAFGAEPIKMKYAASLYIDGKGVGFTQPEGIACSEGRLVVADSGNGRLVLYSLQGGEITGGTEIKIPQVLYPVRVAITSAGDLLVLDERQRKIARLTREGVFKQYVDLGGLPTEGMVVPAGISVDGSDNIYILDVSGGRVLVLDAEGKFQRQINFPKDYGFMTDVAADPKGTVFVVDAVKSMVYSNVKDPAVLTPITRSLKEDLKFPSDVITDKKGTLYISDQNGGGVVIVGQDGEYRNRMLTLGWKEGAVRYPTQTCIDKEGNLFVADRENNRIQKFSPLK